MEQPVHSLSTLFAQLGLPNDPASIERFVNQHKPLSDDVELADAPFWNRGQASFLREEIIEDADWAEVIDQLNVMLRG